MVKIMKSKKLRTRLLVAIDRSIIMLTSKYLLFQDTPTSVGTQCS